jgi:hypothetical protein
MAAAWPLRRSPFPVLTAATALTAINDPVEHLPDVRAEMD